MGGSEFELVGWLGRDIDGYFVVCLHDLLACILHAPLPSAFESRKESSNGDLVGEAALPLLALGPPSCIAYTGQAGAMNF